MTERDVTKLGDTEAVRFYSSLGLDLTRCFRCKVALPPAPEAESPAAPGLRWCAECTEADRVKQAEDAARAAAERERLTLRALAIPKAFLWSTFDAPELRVRVRAPTAVDEAIAAAEHRQVMIIGEAGSGKTSLACAMLRRAGRGLFAGAYWIAKARHEHRLGDGEAPEVDRAIMAPLLVLDDLGLEQVRNTAVSEVIYERHAAERSTIVTTGFGFKALVERYGDGIARRMTEGATIIRCGAAASKGPA